MASALSKKDRIVENLDRRREELESNKVVSTADHSVVGDLWSWSRDILSKIETASEAGGTAIRESQTLEDISDEMGRFSASFAESAWSMPSYQKKKLQEAAMEIKSRYLLMQDEFKPKKKFGFKSRNKGNSHEPKNPEKPKEEQRDGEPDRHSDKDLAAFNDFGGCVVTNADSKSEVVVDASSVLGKDVIVSGLKDCKVIILGVSETLHATQLENVTLICGPVKRSVFVEKCGNCRFVFACQQLRVHSTSKSQFYLHVCARGIIEDCRELFFAPYNLMYPEMSRHFEESGLDVKVNHWDDIDDFNWLSNDVRSPNWSILPPGEQTSTWDVEGIPL